MLRHSARTLRVTDIVITWFTEGIRADADAILRFADRLPRSAVIRHGVLYLLAAQVCRLNAWIIDAYLRWSCGVSIYDDEFRPKDGGAT